MQITAPVNESVWIELSLIDLRPDARPHSYEDIDKLAQSMSMRQLQSIIVCKLGERLEVIAGVGRVLAARKLGWVKIRADVYESLAEIQKLSMMFDENEDRESPPALYQAKLIQTMLQQDGRTGMTQEQIASAIGKGQTTVSKYLSLQALSPQIWADMNQFIKLGLKHFTQILRIENKDEQCKVAKVAVEKDLSSNELKLLVDKQLGVKSGAKKMGRPKQTKSLGEDGFEVKQKKDYLLIRAVLPLSADTDAFLSRLHDEILRIKAAKSVLPSNGNGKEREFVSATAGVLPLS